MTSSGTVLIVDDDESICYLVRTNIEMESNYEVVGEAHDGDEAITFVQKERPDFVIMDQLMPKVDGATAASAMRTLHPEVRIVAYSGLDKQRPEWADATLAKDEFSRITSVLDSLSS